MSGISFDPTLEAVVMGAVVQAQQNTDATGALAVLKKAMQIQSDSVSQIMREQGVGNTVDALA